MSKKSNAARKRRHKREENRQISKQVVKITLNENGQEPYGDKMRRGAHLRGF